MLVLRDRQNYMMATRSGILHLRRFFQLHLATPGCSPAFQTSISSQELRNGFGVISRTPATSITNMKTSAPYLQFRFLSTVAKDGGLEPRPESAQASNSVEAVINPDSDTERPADYKPSKRHDLAMLFTCKVCETRSAKTMSRKTYETGIVLVRCPKCRNLHLIADRLGWFGEPGSVEDFLEQQGVAVRKGVEETYEFSVEDLKGWTPPASNDPQSSG